MIADALRFTPASDQTQKCWGPKINKDDPTAVIRNYTVDCYVFSTCSPYFEHISTDPCDIPAISEEVGHGNQSNEVVIVKPLNAVVLGALASAVSLAVLISLSCLRPTMTCTPGPEVSLFQAFAILSIAFSVSSLAMLFLCHLLIGTFLASRTSRGRLLIAVPLSIVVTLPLSLLVLFGVNLSLREHWLAATLVLASGLIGSMAFLALYPRV